MSVINLVDRPDRWELFQERWKHTGLKYERSPSVRGHDLESCYASLFHKHIEILEDAYKKGEKYCLILEDDAVPCENFDERWKEIQDHLHSRDDWDFFNGGCIHIGVRSPFTKIQTIPKSILINVKSGATTHFIYFRVESALKKLKEWKDGYLEFDSYYHLRMNAIACVPFLSVQANGKSDLFSENRTEWDAKFKQDEMLLKYRLLELQIQIT